MMTVAEMIEKLEGLPQDLQIGGWRNHFLPVLDADNNISIENATEDVETETGIETRKIKVVVISFNR